MNMRKSASSFLSDCAIGRVDPRTDQRSVFAARRINAGELIAVFGGSIVTPRQIAQLGPGAGRYALQVDEDLYLLSTRDGPGDWINHSCQPNAGFRGQVSLVAMHTIPAGDEICFDYAMADGSPYDEFDCQCGTPRCRGRVRGSDWRIPELWIRYQGHFSTYLAARIAGLLSAQPSLVVGME